MRRLLQRVALYTFHVTFARPVLRWIVGVRYRRRSDVPGGSCLVVANHNSHLDAAVLMTLFPLRRLAHVHPVAAADYFGSSWFMRTLAMLLMNGVPIQRRPARGDDPLAPLVTLLKAGKTLVFFPEGSRGEAGVVARFRSGVGKLIQDVPGLPGVPVYLSGPERIWPRGEVVPVPLNIDAHVGRPRTYPPLEDAHALAELVRQDVLALAPPPPPLPGERPAPPLRVAVCGIDGAAVTGTFRLVMERLGRHGASFGVAADPLEADSRGMRDASSPWPAGGKHPWLGLLATVFRADVAVARRRFADLVERLRLLEASSRGRDTRFVVEHGSAVLDLLAQAAGKGSPLQERDLRELLHYLTGERQAAVARSWRLIRAAPATWLISTLHLARAGLPQVLALLTVPVGKPARDPEEGRRVERLQAAYHEAGEVLRRRRRVEVLELDFESVGAAGAADRIEALCVALARAAWPPVSTAAGRGRTDSC